MEILQKWQQVWRLGFAPQLSLRGLQALEKALESDDARLLQGTTCYPPVLEALKDRPVEACCAISFAGWLGDDKTTVGEIDHWFQLLCDGAGIPFSDPAACRYFLNWYDDTPRDEMRTLLLAEVRASIAQRQVAA